MGRIKALLLLLCLPSLTWAVPDFCLVQQALPTSPATQNYTCPSFGTPTGAMLFVGRGVTAGTIAANAAQSMFFFDGIRNCGIAGESPDAADPTAPNRSITAAACLRQLVVNTNTAEVEATCSFIDGGTALTLSTAPAVAYLATVFMWKDIPTYVGSFDTAGSDAAIAITAPGFTPTDAFTLTTRQASVPNSAVGGRFVMGMAHNGGTQASLAWAELAAATSAEAAHIEVTAVQTTISDTAVGTIFTITSYDATGFTIDPNAVEDTGSCYMALRVPPNIGSMVGNYSSKTSGGTATITTGFKPRAALFLQSLVDTLATLKTDAQAGGFGMGAFAGASQQFCQSSNFQDAAAAANTASKTDNDQVICLPLHDQAAGLTAALSSRDATTVTLNWSETNATARLGLIWAIQETFRRPRAPVYFR